MKKLMLLALILLLFCGWSSAYNITVLSNYSKSASPFSTMDLTITGAYSDSKVFAVASSLRDEVTLFNISGNPVDLYNKTFFNFSKAIAPCSLDNSQGVFVFDEYVIATSAADDVLSVINRTDLSCVNSTTCSGGSCTLDFATYVDCWNASDQRYCITYSSQDDSVVMWNVTDPKNLVNISMVFDSTGIGSTDQVLNFYMDDSKPTRRYWFCSQADGAVSVLNITSGVNLSFDLVKSINHTGFLTGCRDLTYNPSLEYVYVSNRQNNSIVAINVSGTAVIDQAATYTLTDFNAFCNTVNNSNLTGGLSDVYLDNVNKLFYFSIPFNTTMNRLCILNASEKTLSPMVELNDSFFPYCAASTNPGIRDISKSYGNSSGVDYRLVRSSGGQCIYTFNISVVTNVTTPTANCTYSGSGDWAVRDVCTIANNTDLANNNLYCLSGCWLTINANVTNFNTLFVHTAAGAKLFVTKGLGGLFS